VDLSRSLDQVLQVSPGQEIAQRHELAMCLVLDIYHTPAVFPTAHGLPADDHITLRANYGEWDHVPDALVELHLLFIILICIKRIEADTVVEELCPDFFV